MGKKKFLSLNKHLSFKNSDFVDLFFFYVNMIIMLKVGGGLLIGVSKQPHT